MRNRLTWWALALTLAAIPVLGYVQWRWIDRVSESELLRESERLSSSAARLSAEFDTEITRAHLAFLPSPTEPPVEDFFHTLKDWTTRAAHPDLIRAIVLELPDDAATWRIGRDGKVTSSAGLIPGPARGNGPPRRGPAIQYEGQPALAMPLGGFPQFPGLGQEPGPMRRPRPNRGGPPPEGGRPSGIRLVVFEREALTGWLRQLIARHVGTDQYDFELRDGDRVLLGQAHSGKPDGTARLFAVRPECLIDLDQAGPGRRGPAPPWFRLQTDFIRVPARDCSQMKSEGRWEIRFWHRSGSIAAAMRGVRTRNMAVAFGVLSLLTVAVGALWLALHRARILARRQVEFAMSVSHELRTPLTVMRLAGDNLASGIAMSPEQTRRYGETIRRESERLGLMLEQVLTFARSERPDWQVRTSAVRPEAILDAALAATESILREAGCTLEREIEAGLPDIQADANLMTSVLVNLLTNAARHGAAGQWVRARAISDEGQVLFEIADRGPGIPTRDLRRIFQPFYRGKSSGSTRGAGLGLHLARRIAEAHGGSISVDSAPGAGTAVRVRVPVARAQEELPV